MPKEKPTNQKEKKLEEFFCDVCDKVKKEQPNLAKVNGLGIDPHKLCKICADCIKRVDVIKDRKDDYEWE